MKNCINPPPPFSSIMAILLLKALFATTLAASTSYAQLPAPQFNAEPSTVGPAPQFGSSRAEGKMLIFQIVPQDKTAKLFVLGKKQAELNFKDTKILKITAFNKEKTEILQFKDDGSTYTITNWPSWKNDFELNISAQYQKQKEDVKLQIKGQP